MEHPLAERRELYWNISWTGTSPLITSNSTKHAEALGRLRVRWSSSPPLVTRYLTRRSKTELARDMLPTRRRIIDAPNQVQILCSVQKLGCLPPKIRCRPAAEVGSVGWSWNTIGAAFNLIPYLLFISLTSNMFFLFILFFLFHVTWNIGGILICCFTVVWEWIMMTRK